MNHDEHNIPDMHQGEGVRWNSQDHAFEPTTEFDYDAVDRGNPLVAAIEEASPIPDRADTLREVFAHIFEQGFSTRREVRIAFTKFVSMVAALRPELLDNQSYQTIGRLLGLTKAAVSNAALQFSDRFGIHVRRSRRESTRATFAQAQRGHASHHKPKDAQ